MAAAGMAVKGREMLKCPECLERGGGDSLPEKRNLQYIDSGGMIYGYGIGILCQFHE
jgi:hypothetical protein